MTPIEHALARLERVRRCGSGWSAKCPAHDDRVLSLSVGEGEDGRALLHCHAGCTFNDVIAAAGIRADELFPRPESPSPPPRKTAPQAQEPQHSSDEALLADCQRALLGNEKAVARLGELRGWTRDGIERLGLGLEDGQVILPVRDPAGALRGLLRYQPNPELRQEGMPKLDAPAGTPRELFPGPETLAKTEEWVLLVEGEPDAVAAFSAGLQAVGVPGVNGWKAPWAARFRGRRIAVIADCDETGRKAATARAEQLVGVAEDVRLVDLAPDRDDGFDLTDFLQEGTVGQLAQMIESAEPHRLESGATVLEDVRRFLARHLAVEEPIYDLLAIWAAHTHAIDHFGTTAYLHVTSAEPASGKTRVLELLELLVREPMRGSSVSTASLFRGIEQLKPTLLLDEIDNLLADTKSRTDMIAILNDGYRRGGKAYRIGGVKNDELKVFNVFAAKAFAGLKEIPVDALRSRCLRIEVKPRTRSEPGEGFIYEDEQPEGESLQQRLACCFTEIDSRARPSRLEGVSDRTWESVRPLVILADLTGGDWPQRVREAIKFVVAGAGDHVESNGVRLLADCQRVFDQTGKDELSKQELLDGLTGLHDAPYGEWDKFTTNQLSRRLKKYGIPSDCWIHDSTGKSHRGWTRRHFKEPWERWLPPDHPDKRANRADRMVEPVPSTPEVCDEQSPHAFAEAVNPHEYTVCTLSTVSVPLPGDPDFRDFLNRVYEAGHITQRERHQRRILHNVIRRANGYQP